MPYNAAAYFRNRFIVAVHKIIRIPSEIFFNNRICFFGRIVNVIIFAANTDIVNGINRVIIFMLIGRCINIAFNTAVNIDYPVIFFLQIRYFIIVTLCIFAAHAPCCIKFRIRMSRKADVVKFKLNGFPNDFLGSVFSVTVNRVSMQISSHDVIFSCLTFLSIT